MEILEWIRFGIAAALILSGVVIIGIAIFGVFRFNFVINRMHIAAACDTLGIMMILFGLIILNGFNVMSLKLLLIIGFMWLANPVSSHLICKLEIETNENIEEECEVIK
ncbi:MAG: monovalent cation/H(+) antiporter subunit G [Erysipelotrichaceae bacterium]|nr:monovalent cation/H(+) antiporter subunit G [Erysipelotrichaceae bacterium]